MAVKAKINGDIVIKDGNTDLRSLKELNTQVNTNTSNINKLTAVQLYSNDTGTREITINNLSQYSYIDIEFRTAYYDRKVTKRMYLNSSVFKENIIMGYFPYDNRIQQVFADLEYNGSNKLKIINEYFFNYNISSSSIAGAGALSYLRITRIYGYK